MIDPACSWDQVCATMRPHPVDERFAMDWSWFTGRQGRAYLARGSERYQASGLSCHLGTITDLSATGARIKFNGSAPVGKGDSVQLTVSTEMQSVRATARVAWIRRGLKGGEIGLQFVGVRPGVQAALVQLARYGCISTDPCVGEAPAGAAKSAPPTVEAAIEVENLYALLGVDRAADSDQIRAAYHRLAMRMHPDVCKEPGAAERFALVSKAYSVLRNDAVRAKYDALLARSKAA